MLLARVLNNASLFVWDTYAKLFLVCMLRLFNPLRVLKLKVETVMKLLFGRRVELCGGGDLSEPEIYKKINAEF